MKNKEKTLGDLIENFSIQEIRGRFKTTQTDIDPETGAISWDVEYSTVDSIEKSLESVVDDLKRLVREHPEDEKLEKLQQVFLNFKKGFKTHITRKYGR